MALSVCFHVSGPKIVHEAFDDEVVIINLDTGNYYSVDGIAAEIWARIDGETVQEIVDDLAGRYGTGEDEVAVPVTRFLDELRSEGLIVPDGTRQERAARGRKATAPSGPGNGHFQAPLLHKFDDMQELLLLDPIHDFDDAGWPIAKPAQPREK